MRFWKRSTFRLVLREDVTRASCPCVSRSHGQDAHVTVSQEANGDRTVPTIFVCAAPAAGGGVGGDSARAGGYSGFGAGYGGGGGGGTAARRKRGEVGDVGR